MHFLMPHVFQSHKEFKEWFANPLTGMIEGSREYNESLIRRLHKVSIIFWSLNKITPQVNSDHHAHVSIMEQDFNF